MNKHDQIAHVFWVAILIWGCLITSAAFGPEIIYRMGPLNKSYEDIPAMREQAKRIPGLSDVTFSDDGPDEHNVRLVLKFDGQGKLSIKQPTLESFQGGGQILISKIGNCTVDQAINVGVHGEYVELRFATIEEVTANYDVIYQTLNAKGLCY